MPSRPKFCHRTRNAVFSAAAALLLTATAACGDKAEQEASYISRGKEAAAKGDLAGSDVLLRNALQINPKSVQALYLLAENAERRGDIQSAYRIYLRVTEEDPNNVGAQAKVGQVYAAGGDLVRAKEQADKAVNLDPENPQVLLLLGLIDFRSKDYDKARDRAAAVLAKDPGNVDATGLLARILEEQGKLDEAVAVYDATLQLKPDATPLRVMKTRALERGNRLDEAEASYRDLIAREPKVYAYRLGLARELEKRGRTEEAETVLRETIAAGVGASQPKLELVAMMVRQNDIDGAEAELLRMATAAPEEYPLQFKLAERYLRTDRPDDAKSVLEAVVKRDPEGPNGITARLALARIALRQGEAERADGLIAEVLGLEAGNADALTLRASRALARKEPEPAIIDLRTVLRDDPNSKEAQRMLAAAYFMAGKSDLAEKQLVSLLEQNAGDVGVKYDLAYLQARRGASGEAMALLDEVASEAPQAVAPLRAKAMMMIAEHQWAGAEETIKRIADLPDQQRLADMLMGVLYLASDRPKEAIGAFGKAHELAPTASAPIDGVVRAYLKMRDVEGATQFVHKLTEKNPDSAYLFNSYGELLLLQGKPGDAIAALDKASTLKPDWALPYFNLSRAYVATGDPGRGIEQLDAGLKKAPDNPLLLRARADALLVRGEYPQALAGYLKLAEVSPDDKDAVNNAAALIADYSYQDPAELKRAVELVKSLEDFNSPNHLDTLGWVRYRSGDMELAKRALTRAVKRRPDDPQIQYHLGMALFRLGDRDGARQALEKATAPGVANYTGIAEARETLSQLAAGGAAGTAAAGTKP